MPYFLFFFKGLRAQSYHWNPSYTSSSDWCPFEAKCSICAEKTPEHLGQGKKKNIPPSLVQGKKRQNSEIVQVAAYCKCCSLAIDSLLHKLFHQLLPSRRTY